MSKVANFCYQYKGSLWNVSVHWDDGTVIWKPLTEIAKFDPITVAHYGHDQDLLSLPGWCFLQCTAKHHHFVQTMHFSAAKCSS